MVKIRMQKLGRRNRSFFRIVVTDARVKRQGLYLEKLGQYDPIEKDDAKALVLNLSRVQYWISKGAQPTEAVANLLKRKDILQAPPPSNRKTVPAAASVPSAQPAAAPAAQN